MIIEEKAQVLVMVGRQYRPKEFRVPENSLTFKAFSASRENLCRARSHDRTNVLGAHAGHLIENNLCSSTFAPLASSMGVAPLDCWFHCFPEAG